MGIETYPKTLTDEPMKDTRVGDTIYVKGVIEAFRTGFRKKEVRVNIGGVSMWIDYEWLMNK